MTREAAPATNEEAPTLRVARRPDGGAPLPPAPRGGFRQGFVALRHRNYRVYWFGQIVSLIGTWMQSVTQPWLVLELGGSPLQLGLVLALQFAPATVFSPLGGVLADRVDKRHALMATQVLGMIEALTLFALTLTGVVEIWHIMVLAAVLGVVNAIDMPVRQAFAAEMVPREDLVNAIALNATSFNFARVVGPAVAGVTLIAFGIAFNFGLNALSYFAVLAGLWLMDPRKLYRPPRPETWPPVLESLREGVAYAVRTPTVVWPLVLLAGIATFGMNFQALLPLFARVTLALDAGGYGALFATMGAGSLVGSLILAFLGGRRPLVPLILGGGAAFIVLIAALGFSRTAPLAFPLVAGAGLAAMLMINTINVTVQHSVPNELRGRVMALYVTVFAGTAPIGGVFAGTVAEVLGAPAAFVIGAGVSVAFLALVAWKLVGRQPSVPVGRRAGAPALRVVGDDD